MRHCYVPQYDSLTLDKITEFLNEGHGHVLDYLPDAIEIHKVSKEWICNVCASVIGHNFQEWVKGQVETRNKNFILKKNMMIEMDPEIEAAFRASTKVSCKC